MFAMKFFASAIFITKTASLVALHLCVNWPLYKLYVSSTFFPSTCHFVKLLFCQFFGKVTVSSTCLFVNLPFNQIGIFEHSVLNNILFCQLAILWSGHFVWIAIQRANLSTCHFINLPLCPPAISSTCHLSICHFVKLPLNVPICQLAISPTCRFVNLPFCQPAILSTCHFVNLPFCQPAILSTCHFANLLFCQLKIMIFARPGGWTRDFKFITLPLSNVKLTKQPGSFLTRLSCLPGDKVLKLFTEVIYKCVS